jgi:hypothetical protein
MSLAFQRGWLVEVKDVVAGSDDLKLAPSIVHLVDGRATKDPLYDAIIGVVVVVSKRYDLIVIHE